MSWEKIEIQTQDGTADAYLSRPDGAATGLPGVLLLMDAFGLRPQIGEMADRIASRGYTVLAPNLFYRAGPDPVGGLPDMSEEGARMEFFQKLRPLMEELTPERIAERRAAVLDFISAALFRVQPNNMQGARS